MNAPGLSKLLAAASAAAPAAAKLKKASQDIEGIFMKDLMTAMRKTVHHQAMGSSMGEEMYQDIFDQAISDTAAKNGTLGLGKTIYRQMAPTAMRTAVSKALLEAAAATKTKASNFELDDYRGQDVRATEKP